MAGMENIEIHSKSYLIRMVNAKPNTTISWTVQPHKKSINFGIFKHPGHVAGLAPTLPSIISNPPPSPNPDVGDFVKDGTNSKDVKDIPSTVLEKLTGLGMRQVYWAGKCEADKISQGLYEVPAGEAGNYALVFDNTFSKNISKTATFFLLTYPTKCQSQIQFGAQLHHSQAIGAALVAAPSQTLRFSPKLKARPKESSDSLKMASAHHALSAIVPVVPEIPVLLDNKMMVFTGVLQKRRRKRHQGYARRFFSLDFTSTTLSYYHDRNSSALRGAIPLSLAAIGANAKTREISIDSGAEIWHLKANSKADFDDWKNAFQKASKLMVEATTPASGANNEPGFYTPTEDAIADDKDWARLESLLSRISGTRDAVRRLCMNTESKPQPPPSPGIDSGPTTPVETIGDDYFRADERRPFWKRKASATNSQTNIFKRNVSGQLGVPPSGTESLPRSTPPIAPPLRSPGSSQFLRFNHHEVSMNDHCRAVLRDLDSVVGDFSALVTENKQRTFVGPRSAISRRSIQSIESQEFFDAEDGGRSTFLTIQNDSDAEDRTEDEAVIGDDDSATSSDIDDGDVYAQSKRAARSGSLSSLLPPRAKSLSPLPFSTVHRRLTVPPPAIMPPSLIGFLRKNVGKDLSTISMHISANEPTSMLQRASEQLEYSTLLDRAAKATDGVERLVYVAAFAISSLSAARIKERSLRKPFNPMLGETFELVREDRGFRFISEKVSHRPVQLALLAESTDWAFTQSPMPSQKFWGKSSEIITEGKVRVLLHASGEVLSWSAATCFLRNILAGEKYVEPVGTMTILNETTGHKAVVNFKAKGMFSGRSEEVDVQTYDAHGTELPLGLHGTWTHCLQLKEHGNITKTVMWTAGPLVDHAPKHYGMTSFAATLNEITGVEENKLPPTDSRLRPDQRLLEQGDHERAEDVKNQLEEEQRARRREMEANEEQWKPRWFIRVERAGEVVWRLKTGKDGYWEERARGEWTGVVPVLKVDPSRVG